MPKITIPKGWKKISEYEDFSEYEYTKNGLRAIIGTRGFMPTVGVMVTYLVGSRFEGLGTTGYTHILEHMMFQGTEKRPTSMEGIWSISAEGGIINATTWTDRTNYFAIAPKDRLKKILAIEADRMRNLLLREEDLAAEMRVVWNEYEIGENDPAQAIDKAMWAAAFIGHGYHHSTIGWRGDIENVTTHRLREFYDTYYWPNNAVVTVVGDTTVHEALTAITKEFGPISASPHTIPIPPRTEPKQEGIRRTTISRKGGIPRFHIGFKSVAAQDDDAVAIAVLLTVLSGGSASLLEKEFTDTGVVQGIEATKAWWHDPGLIEVYGSLTSKTTPVAFEKKFFPYIFSLSEKITKEHVSRAKELLRASKVWEQDGFMNLLSTINEGIAAGDWTYHLTLGDRVKNVTHKQVVEVAKKYLREDQMTVGWYLPKK